MTAANEENAKTKASAYFTMKDCFSNGVFNKMNCSHTVI